MIIPGRIQNGVVVFEGGPVPPEGTAVNVVFVPPQVETISEKKQRIQVPLVPSSNPGSVVLTSARIAELLDDEDAAPGR